MLHAVWRAREHMRNYPGNQAHEAESKQGRHEDSRGHDSTLTGGKLAVSWLLVGWRFDSWVPTRICKHDLRLTHFLSLPIDHVQPIKRCANLIIANQPRSVILNEVKNDRAWFAFPDMALVLFIALTGLSPHLQCFRAHGSLTAGIVGLSREPHQLVHNNIRCAACGEL